MDQFKEITEDLIINIKEKREFEDLKSFKDNQDDLLKTISFDIDFYEYAKKYQNIKIDGFPEIMETVCLKLFSPKKSAIYNLSYEYYPDEYHHIDEFKFESNDTNLYSNIKDIINFINLKLKSDLFKEILKYEQLKKEIDKESLENIKKLATYSIDFNQVNNIENNEKIKINFINKLKENFSEDIFNILVRSDAFSLIGNNFLTDFVMQEGRIKINKDSNDTLEAICNNIRKYSFVEKVDIIDETVNRIKIITKDNIKLKIKRIKKEVTDEFFLNFIDEYNNKNKHTPKKPRNKL